MAWRLRCEAPVWESRVRAEAWLGLAGRAASGEKFWCERNRWVQKGKEVESNPQPEDHTTDCQSCPLFLPPRHWGIVVEAQLRAYLSLSFPRKHRDLGAKAEGTEEAVGKTHEESEVRSQSDLSATSARSEHQSHHQAAVSTLCSQISNSI